MITGLAHVCFTASDLARSEAFYRDALGLAHAFDFTNDKGEKFGVYLHAGGRTFLELFQGKVDPPAQGQAYRHICLEVDDLAATVAALRERGVDVTDPKLGSDQSWQAWLADPDGNRIELHQYTPRSWQNAALLAD
jgi:catechol 2,3-dioxygenase-like lactoylglutathione lyase family enzyme